MKPNALVGVLLIVLGVVALVYGGVTYTKRETVLDMGPIHATADHQKTLPLSPILGIVAVAGGVVLLVTSSRRRA
jgi:drug/metabolite transporter (DMT)-like permease